MCPWTRRKINQFCARPIRYFDHGITMCPWTFRPTPELSDRAGRYLNSSLTMCPWTGRPTNQFCAKPTRYLDYGITMCPRTWRSTAEFSDRANKHLDSEFTTCPWAWIFPSPQSTEHSNSGLASWFQIMGPPNLLSIAPVCPLEPWPPWSLQTTSPPSQDSTGLRSHWDTSLSQNSMTGCPSTLQRSEHLSTFPPWIYFSLRSLWPAIWALFILGGVFLLRRKLHHALGDKIVQWLEDFVLKHRAGNEKARWEKDVEETQALITVESLAEILQLRERYSIVRGELEALKQEAKQCSEKQAQLHDVERFFIQMKVFLDVSTLHAVPKG